MNLYELTLDAELQVDTYKNPEIDEWRAAIDPILQAAGQPIVGIDSVDFINLNTIELSITTSYSVRCCDQTNTIRIPLNILKAANPIKAANLFRLNKLIAKAKSDILNAERTIETQTKTLETLAAEYLRISL